MGFGRMTVPLNPGDGKENLKHSSAWQLVSAFQMMDADLDGQRCLQ